jgi:hypothetical protein
MAGRGMYSPRIKNGKLQFLLTRSLRVVVATHTDTDVGLVGRLRLFCEI